MAAGADPALDLLHDPSRHLVRGASPRLRLGFGVASRDFAGVRRGKGHIPPSCRPYRFAAPRGVRNVTRRSGQASWQANESVESIDPTPSSDLEHARESEDHLRSPRVRGDVDESHQLERVEHEGVRAQMTVAPHLLAIDA